MGSVSRLVFLNVGLASALFGAAAGCGYSLQRSTLTPFFEKEDIKKVYVAPLENETYKAGVENLVYNQVVKVLAANRRVTLVRHDQDADAILSGVVTDASYGASANTTSDALYPAGNIPGFPRGSANISVATEYSGTLTCRFTLKRRVIKPGKRTDLWADSFSKAKPFPGNNQLGVFGTTSALINESEFDRVLRDLAESMAADLHESMLAGF